jgi:hypothetical protein
MKGAVAMPPEQAANSTLGDLIVALTDETSRFVRDEEEVYKVVAYIVSDLLNSARPFSGSWH